MSKDIKTLEENIENALNIAWSYGQIQGDHYKAWAIDQIVRALCGSESKYKDWVAAYEAPLTGDDYYVWDKGIAP